MGRVANRLCNLRKARRFFRLFEELKSVRHSLAVATHLVGLAAKARPIAGQPRFRTRVIECDVLPLRAASRAARFAVDPGCMNRADYAPVPASIAAHEGRPGSVRIEARDI